MGGEGFCQYCNEKTKCGTFFQNDDGMRMRMFVREGGEGWQSSNNVQNVLMRCRVWAWGASRAFEIADIFPLAGSIYHQCLLVDTTYVFLSSIIMTELRVLRPTWCENFKRFIHTLYYKTTINRAPEVKTGSRISLTKKPL